MSHPYISIVAGMERLRAGFGPEHYTADGHCPINKIFGAILTHGLAETVGKLFLLNIETARWEQFPCGRWMRLQHMQGWRGVLWRFPTQKVFLSQGFPSLASRNCSQRGTAASQGGGEGHGKLPSEAAIEHPKGNYCLHGRLLFSFLILLLYRNICQAIIFDFRVFTVAEGR